MNIIDISRPISNDMMVYPGSQNTQVEFVSTIPDQTYFSSVLTIGMHVGTHVDAPKHTLQQGDSIDTIVLSKCIGTCIVLDLTHLISVVKASDFQSFTIPKDQIILLKTRNSFTDSDVFDEDFVALDDSAADFLASKNPKAIGIDGPSIKKFRQKNRVHDILLEQNILIYEWLDLSQTRAEEKYQFIGFPLRIKDGEASSVRAVLVEDKNI